MRLSGVSGRPVLPSCSGAVLRWGGFLIVLTIFASLTWSCGSVPRGSFGVEVTDPAGEPVPGVEVRMSGSGGDFSGTTDEHGSVVFPSVARGSYEVSASRAGFEAVRMGGVQARPGGFLDLRMRPLAEVVPPLPPAAAPEPVPEAAPETRPPPPEIGAGEPYEIVEVFYGTDRNRRDGEGDPRRIYGGDRGELRLGTLEVSIPKDHRMGELEAPRWWRFEFRPDPRRHVVLLKAEELPEDDFVRRLRERVEETEHREAFVFVHGYNVDFDEAARRTAQIAYDIHDDLVPILFSWPSRGTVAGYPADETNVAWAEPDLREFLTLVAERSGAAEVHVIAHSMGNRAVTAVLEDFVQAGRAGDASPRFEEIVLVAPDIDADRFRRDIAPVLVPAGERITLYGSSRDRALKLSHRFHDYPRIGDLSAGVAVMPGIDLIDATAVDTSLTGHSYFADGDSVLADLFHLFREGLAPPRSSLEPVGDEPELYWRFVPP